MVVGKASRQTEQKQLVMGSRVQLLQLQLIMQLVVVLVVVAVLLSSSGITTAAPPTRQDLVNLGCPDRCGNVSIPYPFGTKENCYLDERFLITCNASVPYSPNSVSTTYSNNETNYTPISNISVEEGSELIIMQPISRDCYEYDPIGNPLPNNTYPNLQLGNMFSVSITRNKLTAIGCDTQAVIQFAGNGVQSFVSTGCTSQCNYPNDPTDGSCSGIGCCQISLPQENGPYLSLFLSSYAAHRKVFFFNPCSYAFIAEESAFNFSTSYIQEFNQEMMPLVLDWSVVGRTNYQNCALLAITNSSSYECGQNSFCNDSSTGAGYICKCSTGYQGNPYLSDGCQDIDECANPNLNDCEFICVNLPGDYKCTCPKRYRGDGRRDGKGCIRESFWEIQAAIGFSTGAALVLLSCSSLYWILRKRRISKLKEKFFVENGGSMLQQQLSKQFQGKPPQEVIKIFTSEELKLASDNYSESRIIGRGGNGKVYKGVLADKRTVAIKKAKKLEDKDQIDQFINELIVLSQINHRNVVKLLGCCLETEVPSLVYEFITNGTLFEHIHMERRNSSPVSWETRLRIATETAGVLSYLHSAASVPIIHRDVKSTNILLDDNFVAKVADFGASRLIPIDRNQLTTMVQGTLGYLDPQYQLTSQLTEKSDVYSFGVVLVELITGRVALSFDRPEEERMLAHYFVLRMDNDRLNEVIDQGIVLSERNTEQLKVVAYLAKRCLQVKGEDRPTMKEVAMELERLIMNKNENHSLTINDSSTDTNWGVMVPKIRGYKLREQKKMEDGPHSL